MAAVYQHGDAGERRTEAVAEIHTTMAEASTTMKIEMMTTIINENEAETIGDVREVIAVTVAPRDPEVLSENSEIRSITFLHRLMFCFQVDRVAADLNPVHVHANAAAGVVLNRRIGNRRNSYPLCVGPVHPHRLASPNHEAALDHEIVGHGRSEDRIAAVGVGTRQNHHHLIVRVIAPSVPIVANRETAALIGVEKMPEIQCDRSVRFRLQSSQLEALVEYDQIPNQNQNQNHIHQHPEENRMSVRIRWTVPNFVRQSGRSEVQHLKRNGIELSIVHFIASY